MILYQMEYENLLLFLQMANVLPGICWFLFQCKCLYLQSDKFILLCFVLHHAQVIKIRKFGTFRKHFQGLDSKWNISNFKTDSLRTVIVKCTCNKQLNYLSLSFLNGCYIKMLRIGQFLIRIYTIFHHVLYM